MGQKADSYGIRLGINKNWSNVWRVNRNSYGNNVRLSILVDRLFKKYVKSHLFDSIDIHVNVKDVIVFVKTHKPSLIIGNKGAHINDIQAKIQKDLDQSVKQFMDNNVRLSIKIKEVSPETSPAVICEELAEVLVAKKSYKNLLRNQFKDAMQNGCLGIKVIISGRIMGRVIARTIVKKCGSIPLQTLSANIYSHKKSALTKSGCCGVKCIMCLSS